MHKCAAHGRGGYVYRQVDTPDTHLRVVLAMFIKSCRNLVSSAELLKASCSSCAFATSADSLNPADTYQLFIWNCAARKEERLRATGYRLRMLVSLNSIAMLHAARATCQPQTVSSAELLKASCSRCVFATSADSLNPADTCLEAAAGNGEHLRAHVQAIAWPCHLPKL